MITPHIDALLPISELSTQFTYSFTALGEIDSSTISTTDSRALETRMKEVQLHKIREEFVLNKQFLQQLEEEAVAFSILLQH